MGAVIAGVFFAPGALFTAFVVKRFKKHFGDGNGNETATIEWFKWAGGFSLLFWVSTIVVVWYKLANR